MRTFPVFSVLVLICIDWSSMANVEEFIRCPSEESLEQCTKEQLLKIVEHYSLDIGDKRLSKENVKAMLKSNLWDMGVLSGKLDKSPCQLLQSSIGGNFTFEQQKELLLLQLEHDKSKRHAELELEKAKLELQHFKLDLIRQGKMAGDLSGVCATSPGAFPHLFDVRNLRLLPQFSEQDPDTFFSV